MDKSLKQMQRDNFKMDKSLRQMQRDNFLKNARKLFPDQKISERMTLRDLADLATKKKKSLRTRIDPISGTDIWISELSKKENWRIFRSRLNRQMKCKTNIKFAG